MESDTRQRRLLRPEPGARAGDQRPGMVADMSVAADRHVTNPEFAIEDLWVGVFGAKVLASGFGRSLTAVASPSGLKVRRFSSRYTGPG